MWPETEALIKALDAECERWREVVELLESLGPPNQPKPQRPPAPRRHLRLVAEERRAA